MNSVIFDKNNVEVKEGDILVFPYITPFGELTDDAHFARKVVFKYGCFGYENSTYFEPLLSWNKKEKGEYIPNCGNKTIYTNKYPFWNDNDCDKSLLDEE